MYNNNNNVCTPRVHDGKKTNIYGGQTEAWKKKKSKKKNDEKKMRANDTLVRCVAAAAHTRAVYYNVCFTRRTEKMFDETIRLYYNSTYYKTHYSYLHACTGRRKARVDKVQYTPSFEIMFDITMFFIISCRYS